MDGKTEGVSFVVTAYNKERYLEATLKSILAQEGDLEREFIVVDDGSSDRSVEIAEDLIGSLANGKVIQQSNGGPGKAQNTGVAAATLPVIKFLDGDDLCRRMPCLTCCRGFNFRASPSFTATAGCWKNRTMIFELTAKASPPLSKS